jgi:hypothetical protein
MHFDYGTENATNPSAENATNSLVARDVAARDAADSAVSAHLECFEFSFAPYLKKKKGHVFQYFRSIVLQYYRHQPLSKVAMKHWIQNSRLQHPTTASKKQKKVVGVEEHQYGEATTVLRRIHCFFSSAFSWRTFIRYLTEPIPDDTRDHFKTVVCTAVLQALEKEPTSVPHDYLYCLC